MRRSRPSIFVLAAATALCGSVYAMSRPAAPVAPGPPVLFGGALPSPVVRGSLGKEVIRRVIYVHVNEIRNCYQQELQARPSLAGRLVVNFHIDDEGQVEELQVSKSTLGLPSLHHCIATAMSRWEFPATRNGAITQVFYPFVLRPRVKETPATGVQISDEELERLGVHKDDAAPAADILF